MRRLLYLVLLGLALKELARLFDPLLRRAPPPPPPRLPDNYSGPVRIACAPIGTTTEITYTSDSLVLIRVERQCGITVPVGIRARPPNETGLGTRIVPVDLLRTEEDKPKPRTYAVSIPAGNTLVLSCGGGVGGGECIFHVQKLTSTDNEWRLWSGYPNGSTREYVTGDCGLTPISGRFYNLTADAISIRVNWRSSCGRPPQIRCVPIGGTDGTWGDAQNNARSQEMGANTRLEVRCPGQGAVNSCAFEVHWLPKSP